MNRILRESTGGRNYGVKVYKERYFKGENRRSRENSGFRGIFTGVNGILRE